MTYKLQSVLETTNPNAILNTLNCTYATTRTLYQLNRYLTSNFQRLVRHSNTQPRLLTGPKEGRHFHFSRGASEGVGPSVDLLLWVHKVSR